MLDRLEKKFGKYAIKNLIYYILGAYVVGYILYLARPEWYGFIVLDPELVMKGQIWRLFTWVCSIPQALNIFIIFMFLFYFFIGKTLEQYMGAFKYNLYIFSGWLFTTLGVMIAYWISYAIAGPSGAWELTANTYYINLTSFLAFAVIFPETKVYLFAIIPVKMKILAWIDVAYLGIQVFSGIVLMFASEQAISEALLRYYGTSPTGMEVKFLRYTGISTVLSILISVLNFLIFFLATAKTRADNKKRRMEYQAKAEEGRRQQQRQQQSGYSQWQRQNQQAAQQSQQAAQQEHRQKSVYGTQGSTAILHKCDVCGRTNITNPELMFRFCSKCTGNHEYCQDHLFTHEHIKQ